MTATDLDELLQLETGVWAALIAGDAEADAALLAEDFLGVYPSGFEGRSGHAGQLADGPTIAEYEIHDARAVQVSSDAWMLAYRAAYRSTQPAAEQEEMYVSSLWIQRDGAWTNLFSQDTPVPRVG